MAEAGQEFSFLIQLICNVEVSDRVIEPICSRFPISVVSNVNAKLRSQLLISQLNSIERFFPFLLDSTLLRNRIPTWSGKPGKILVFRYVL